MPERDRDISALSLEDISTAIERIIAYTSGMTQKEFGNDPKTQDAVIRNLEILGEAVKNLPETFKETYPFVPWKRIAGMRDKLIHHYFGVSTDIVWTTATDDIPKICPALLKIQKMEKEKSNGNTNPIVLKKE